MRLLLGIPILVLTSQLTAQSRSDTAAVRNIVKNEIETWNKGDATGYSRDFAMSVTFTNIRGIFFTGHPGYLKQHEVIFQGIFKNTTLKQEIVSLKFIRPDVAVLETATTVNGAAESPVGVTRDANGRIRTRLMQVVAKENGIWKILTYHNVDVKPQIPFTYPR
jgi:uncharacterized protein (TIGR02246 family)